MRMVHYFLALAAITAPALLTTIATGALHQGGDGHFLLGLITAILCVATQTLVILFMLITGRVLRAAMESRPLNERLLSELNEYFTKQRAYPIALLAGSAAVLSGVLGLGPLIGIPIAVHILVGLGATGLNLWALQEGYRSLLQNQGLLDRAVAELDAIDADPERAAEIDHEAGEPEWRYGLNTRLFLFAVVAWAPTLYWGLVVWEGDFSHVPPGLMVASGVLSAFALLLVAVRRIA